ncbi:MAG: hypothetical protein K0Q59_3065 [Paenibacillus sp.]|nr:hypothetical protein [Paenibacillus sp.]
MSTEKNINRWIACAAAAVILLLPACSNGGASKGQPAEESDSKAGSVDVSQAQLKPAELLIYSTVPSITQDEFERTIAAPIREKYPHYTLKYVITKNDLNMEKLVTGGDVPDITIASLSGMNSSLLPYQLQYDLSPLIKKYKYDIGRFEPAAIQSMQNAAGGKLYGLPKFLSSVVLFYNKDLFDQFGVPYPKDGMTWDDAHNVAVRMTRTVDGVRYRGMSMFYSNMFTENQLSLPFIHATEDKAAVNVPGFQKILNTYKRIYDIAGNKPEGNVSADAELTAFHKNKNIAMITAPMSGYGRFENDPDLNWDMVAAPTYSDAPRVGFQSNTIYYLISNANGKAEQAFQVAAHLSSDEVHWLGNKEGRPTSLKNDEIRAALGKDNPKHKNKNFQALFYNQFAPTPATNPAWDTKVSGSNALLTEFTKMINNGTDINTTLRIAEEKINQAIVAAKSQ